jgi:protein SCO1/2
MKLLSLIASSLFIATSIPARDAPPPAAGSGDDLSIYALDSVWRDGAGTQKPFSSLAGQVRVLAMGYTSCAYACPRILADMRAIERGIGQEFAARVSFTFVSFDSARDTPAVLSRYQRQNDLLHWTFLTGDADSALELSVVLGVKFQQIGSNDFAHSNTIFVIDRAGRILHRQEDLGAKPDGSIAVIRRALSVDSTSRPGAQKP